MFCRVLHVVGVFKMELPKEQLVDDALLQAKQEEQYQWIETLWPI
jgi:hypothetical protein